MPKLNLWGRPGRYPDVTPVGEEKRPGPVPVDESSVLVFLDGFTQWADPCGSDPEEKTGSHLRSLRSHGSKSRVFLSYMNSPRLESPKRLSFNGTQSPSYIYSVGATLSLTHEEHIEEQKLVLYPALWALRAEDTTYIKAYGTTDATLLRLARVTASGSPSSSNIRNNLRLSSLVTGRILHLNKFKTSKQKSPSPLGSRYYIKVWLQPRNPFLENVIDQIFYSLSELRSSYPQHFCDYRYDLSDLR